MPLSNENSDRNFTHSTLCVLSRSDMVRDQSTSRHLKLHREGSMVVRRNHSQSLGQGSCWRNQILGSTAHQAGYRGSWRLRSGWHFVRRAKVLQMAPANITETLRQRQPGSEHKRYVRAYACSGTSERTTDPMPSPRQQLSSAARSSQFMMQHWVGCR